MVYGAYGRTGVYMTQLAMRLILGGATTAAAAAGETGSGSVYLQSPEMRAILRQYLTRLDPIHPARYYFCAENTTALYKDQELDENEMGLVRFSVVLL